MKKMIITGVNGFIGRCAMEYFSKDYEITGIDLADRYCEDGQKSTTISATCPKTHRNLLTYLPECSRM